MRGMTRSCGAFLGSSHRGDHRLWLTKATHAAEPIISRWRCSATAASCCAARSASSSACRCSGQSPSRRLYLQVVKEATPTEAGLQLIPLMGGLLLTSIISGRIIISRTGKYRLLRSGTLLGDRHGTADPHYHSPPLWQLYLFTGVLGSGSGAGDAGAGSGRQNAMPAQTVRRRHLRRDPVPLDWRLHRRGAVWRCSRTCCRATCNNRCREARCRRE